MDNPFDITEFDCSCSILNLSIFSFRFSRQEILSDIPSIGTTSSQCQSQWNCRRNFAEKWLRLRHRHFRRGICDNDASSTEKRIEVKGSSKKWRHTYQPNLFRKKEKFRENCDCFTIWGSITYLRSIVSIIWPQFYLWTIYRQLTEIRKQLIRKLYKSETIIFFIS